MSSKSFVSSAVLHGLVLSLMALNLSFGRMDEHRPPPALLMVDLTKVQVADKTNLPPKAKAVQPKKTAPKPQVKPQPAKTQSTTVRAPQPVVPKPQPPKPVKEAAPVIEPPKPDTTKKKEKAPSKSVSPQKATEQKPAKKYDMKNLLASVEKVRKAPTQTVIPDEPDDAVRQNDGIENGTEGSFTQILTVSERDLIATQLKKCWNVDAGAAGIDDMIIEIRAFVNKDGRIRDVNILNMKNNPSFRAVAESARRAVLICDDKGVESPFRILADKYADHYGEWKELFLRFNPMDGGVF